MKRIFGWIIALLLVGLISYAGVFYYQNLRGAAPAFAPVANLSATTAPQPENTTGLPLSVPAGLQLSTYAKDVSNARVLAFDASSTLLVSQPSLGQVTALVDKNDDGNVDEKIAVVSGLNLPHGLAFFEEKLYVAETDAVVVYTYNATTHKATDRKKIIDLPGGGNHFSRTIGFGPDKKLYISVGSTCNVCVEKDWERAKILVANPDGSGLREFASGLRNSVFFTWHPKTQELWATDMGRDLLGDNTPQEEINIVKDGEFYGWPLCYENRVHDKSFDGSQDASQKCKNSVPPHIMFQAHSAPLGLAFVPTSWGKEYEGDLLVAYHGSWNRTDPTGYKVVRMKLSPDGKYESVEDFLTGWLSGAKSASGVLGRPVDVLFDAKGNLFISDDKAGVIYKLTQLQ